MTRLHARLPLRRCAGRLTLARALALSAVLLLAQALGINHGLRHGHASDGAVRNSASHAPHARHDAAAVATAATTAKAAKAATLADVVGGAHDDGDNGCRLIDALSHDQGPGAAAGHTLLSPAMSAQPCDRATAALAASAFVAYEARGPPGAA